MNEFGSSILEALQIIAYIIRYIFQDEEIQIIQSLRLQSPLITTKSTWSNHAFRPLPATPVILAAVVASGSCDGAWIALA